MATYQLCPWAPSCHRAGNTSQSWAPQCPTDRVQSQGGGKAPRTLSRAQATGHNRTWTSQIGQPWFFGPASVASKLPQLYPSTVSWWSSQGWAHREGEIQAALPLGSPAHHAWFEALPVSSREWCSLLHPAHGGAAGTQGRSPGLW